MFLGANAKAANLSILFLNDALEVARLDARALLADADLGCHGSPFGAIAHQGARLLDALNVSLIVTY